MMHRCGLRQLLMLLACFGTAGALAADLLSEDTPVVSPVVKQQPSPRFSLSSLKSGHTVLQFGGYWGTHGESQQVNIQGLIGDSFRVTNRTMANGLFGVGYYVPVHTYHDFEMSYGMNGFYLAKTSASGNVTQENLFTNLSYNYHASHVPLYAMAKATKCLKSNAYAVTIDAGIGPNFMQVRGFKEFSLDNGVTIPDNAFKDQSSTAFSATFGLGMKRSHVFGSAPLECGYRFYYLGQSHLSPVSNQILNTFSTVSVFGNAIICVVSI